jgi:hypothetical protein
MTTQIWHLRNLSSKDTLPEDELRRQENRALHVLRIQNGHTVSKVFVRSYRIDVTEHKIKAHIQSLVCR